MSDTEGWIRVGELGLHKLAHRSDPTKITFGELAAQYLDEYPFNKLSTRDLYEQIIKRLLLLKWDGMIAIENRAKGAKSLAPSLLQFDVESATRGSTKV
jgi:hypothetical protein